MSELKMLSQTCLKHYESDTCCPRKWKGMWIDKSVPFFSNKFMDYGKYFEYLCLGASAKEDDNVTDLPRLKNGKKSADQIRIEKQVEKFKILFGDGEKSLGYKIKDTQIELTKEGSIERGTVDFDTEGEPILWDLKLTKDLTSTRHPKNWGHPDNMIDVTQAKYYCELYYHLHGVIPQFKYIVFDYSPRMNIKIFTVDVDKEGLQDINERKYSLVQEISVREDWEEIPERWECSSCPLKCESRVAKCLYK